jgi:hypothetical protein
MSENPTPLERLVAWLDGSVAQRFAELGTGVKYRCVLTDWTNRSISAKVVGAAYGPTLGEAILAALEQAKGDPE